MQVVNKKDLSKRSRYYQGMIDLNSIEKGELYNDLKDSIIIFICKFDPFKKGLLNTPFRIYVYKIKIYIYVSEKLEYFLIQNIMRRSIVRVLDHFFNM